MRSEIDIYKEFLKRNNITSPDNAHLIRVLLLDRRERYDTSAFSIKSLWENYIKKNPDSDIEFYNHIPYCFQKCHFCCYPSVELQNDLEISEYIDKLIDFYRFFGKTFENFRFSDLSIGGGTPSLLSSRQMERLFTELFSTFKFKKGIQWSIEFNPQSSSKDKLEVVKKFGFNRVSFGVQSFNKKALDLNKRSYQTYEMVKDVLQDAKNVGFDTVNIDLLVGLYGDDSEGFTESFRKATELKPDTIYIYSLKPGNRYLSDVCKMSQTEFFDWKEKVMESVSDQISIIAQENGYNIPYSSTSEIGMRQFGTLIFNKKDFQYSQRITRKGGSKSSVFGLGTFSHSYIKDEIYYKSRSLLTKNPSDYKFSASLYEEKKEMLTQICYSLTFKGSVSRKRFKEMFGKDLFEEFGEAIDKIKKLRVARTDEDGFYIKDSFKDDWMLFFLFFFGQDQITKSLTNDSIAIKGNQR